MSRVPGAPPPPNERKSKSNGCTNKRPNEPCIVHLSITCHLCWYPIGRSGALVCFPIRQGNKLKADMKSYIPLETAAIFFLANLFPKQGVSSEYVTADFICMGLFGLQGAKTENYKMKNSCRYRDSNSRPLILKSSALSIRLSSLIYKWKFKTSLVEYRLYCAIYSYIVPCGRELLSCIP